MKTILFILVTLMTAVPAYARSTNGPVAGMASSSQTAISSNTGAGSSMTMDRSSIPCFAASPSKPCETYTLVIATDHGIATIPNFNSRQNCTIAANRVKARHGTIPSDAYCVGVIDGR